MPSTIRLALLLVVMGTVLAGWCLAETTSLSMTLFFMLGLPSFALAAVLYVREVVLDLRRHRVL
jgi:hypothetical protein